MANLTTAVAQSLRVVRVTFNVALTDFSVTAATGALNPSNWTLVGQVVDPVPVAPVTALSVAQISTTVLDVTVDDDFSPSCSYKVVAKPASAGGITGVADSPNNEATFVAVALTPPAERDFSVLKMIPRMNFREDDTKDLERFLRVIDEPLQLALHRIDHWTDIIDYDLAPDNHLDQMLKAVGYPFQIALSTIDKRRLLSVLATMMKQKGTIVGCKNAIRFFLGYESDYIGLPNELFGGWTLDDSDLGDGTVLGDSFYYNPTLHGPDISNSMRPWDFYAKIGTPSAVALTSDETTKATAIINYMKPAHTKMLGLSAVLPPPLNPSAAAGASQVTFSWSSVTSAAGYAVFWSKTPAVSPLGPDGAVDPDNTSPYVLTGVTSGETRYGIICARTAGGINGVSSAVVSAVAT